MRDSSMSVRSLFLRGCAEAAKGHGEELIEQDRGAPENTGVDFKASQYARFPHQHTLYLLQHSAVGGC
jgi:hypothetical protein